MRMRLLAFPVVLVLSALWLAGCSLFQIPRRVDTLSSGITDAAAAETATTDFNLQVQCAAAAKRFYAEVAIDSGRVLTGFSSNYNGKMGSCLMTYAVTWSHAANDLRKIVIVAPVRRFTYGSCTIAKAKVVSRATHCWVRWYGRILRHLSAARFDGYQAQLMMPARRVAPT